MRWADVVRVKIGERLVSCKYFVLEVCDCGEDGRVVTVLTVNISDKYMN